MAAKSSPPAPPSSSPNEPPAAIDKRRKEDLIGLFYQAKDAANDRGISDFDPDDRLISLIDAYLKT